MAAEFAVTMSVGSGVDISSADNIQVEHGDISVNVKFDKVVDLDDAAYGEDATAADQSGTKFGADDLLVIAYNEFGGTVALGTPLSQLLRQSPMPTVKTSLSLCLTKRMPKEFSYFLRNIRLRSQIRELILTLA